jgi:cytochrome c553
MKLFPTCLLLALSLALTQSLAFGADDPVNGGRMYAEYCASCHGSHGQVSTEVVPNILGQYPGYMLTQMAAFLADDEKEARRGIAGSLKRSILSDLSVQDIRDVVTWIGTIDYKIVGASKEEAESRGEMATNGWWLANYAGCGNCHGDDQMGLRVRNPGTGELDPGVGAPLTPKLVGLKGGYIKRQLEAYATGQRAGGMAAMKHIMAPLFLTPRLIQAVGKYADGVRVVPVAEGQAQE